MNLAAGIARAFTRLPFREATHDAAPSMRPKRRSARGVLVFFTIFAILVNFTAYLIIDVSNSPYRDPEYSRRVISLKERVAENPDRPLVLVIGSSRASMGVRPSAWEEVRPNEPGRPDPMIFNMSLVGSGPLMELMCLRRAYQDGIRPDAVVLEYWPPFLREDGPYFEPDRIDHARLSDRDRPLVREYFRDPEAIEWYMNLDRVNPLFRTRHRLLAQVFPRWQPWDKRMDMSWGMLDAWGWLAGIDATFPADPKTRSLHLQHCEKIYRPQFQSYTVHPLADRAFRDTIALARSHGTKIAFVYMPESTEFRSWMTPDVERLAAEHLAKLRSEFDIPLINARTWMHDGYMTDGFHLSRIGAAEFTKRFGPAVAATFPNLGVGR